MHKHEFEASFIFIILLNILSLLFHLQSFGSFQFPNFLYFEYYLSPFRFPLTSRLRKSLKEDKKQIVLAHRIFMHAHRKHIYALLCSDTRIQMNN